MTTTAVQSGDNFPINAIEGTRALVQEYPYLGAILMHAGLHMALRKSRDERVIEEGCIQYGLLNDLLAPKDQMFTLVRLVRECWNAKRFEIESRNREEHSKHLSDHYHKISKLTEFLANHPELGSLLDSNLVRLSKL